MRQVELKLFNAIPAMAQKGEHAVGAAHLSRTGDNEAGPSTAQVSFHFRNPTQMSCNWQTTALHLLLRAFAWLDCCSQ